MRDPERVKRISEKLVLLWELVPERRLGQLMDNARTAAQSAKVPGSGTDLFYIEDEPLEAGLNILLERYRSMDKTNGTSTDRS